MSSLVERLRARVSKALPAYHGYVKADMAEAANEIERLREALEPFAAFRLNGFSGPMLEVCEPHPDNPSPRIDHLELRYFDRAREALSLHKGGRDGD